MRPTLEELQQNTRLLIALRWAAGLGILLGTGFANLVLGIGLHTAPLYGIGIAVLSYNILLAFVVYRFDSLSLETLRRVAWAQILLDWIAMTALVHFTGGVTSPALVYFMLHATLAGLILLPWQVRSFSLLAVALIGGLALMERAEWLPHIIISEFEISDELYRNTTYITAVVFFFGSAIFVLSELVTAIAQRLRQREQRIRQLYEARSTFLRVATHELRAPLAAGLSLMHNIEQGYAGDFNEQQAAILNRISSRLDGLRILIDDLLTFARTQEANTSQMPLEPVGVRNVLLKIIEREMPNADAKRVTVESEIAEDPGVVMAGEMGVAIILGNMLNNAIKYTPDEGRVTVYYAVEGHHITIKISDTGIGIPAAELPNIFTEFFRASNAKSAQITGTGIGLSTVYMLVKRYKGHISLESEEGQGTTIVVQLPLASRYTLLSAS